MDMMNKSYEPLIKKWEKRLLCSLHMTWFVPLFLLVIQILSVGKHIDIDITDLNNWMGVERTFSVPTRAFLLLVTITTVLGLYTRWLQTNMQLLLTSEQLSNAIKQSERAERQLELVEKQSAFSMYIEHFKAFSEHVDTILLGGKSLHRTYQEISGESILVNKSRLYKAAFPENSPKNVQSLDLVSSQPFFSHDNGQPFDLSVMSSYSCKPNYNSMASEMELNKIVSNLSKRAGIAIKTHTNNGEDFSLQVFIADISRTAELLRNIGLLNHENYQAIKDTVSECCTRFGMESREKTI